MGKLSQDMRNRFTAWLGDRPDDVILRKVFALMLAGTVTVLALDYLELSGLREEIAANIPQLSTDDAPAALPMDMPTLTPLRRPDGALAAKMKLDRKSTRLNSSHMSISYAVFCLKKKNKTQ